MAEPALHDPPTLVPVPFRIVATWPVGTFVENIAALPDGGFAVCLHNRRAVELLGADGTRRRSVPTPHPPAGILLRGEALFVVAGEPGAAPHRVLRLSPDGAAEEWLEVPDSLFLNGFTPRRGSLAFAVDSFRGELVAIDLEARSARTVLHHDLLAKASDVPLLPGANGIKAAGDALLVTNTDRALLLRLPMRGDTPSGAVEVVAERLRGDDIALAAQGDIFLATHRHNTLVRLGPDGTRTSIAGPDQGMVGCTACAFGLGAGDRQALFVTTTGGMLNPLDGVVQPAKLVRLEVGVEGVPVAFR